MKYIRAAIGFIVAAALVFSAAFMPAAVIYRDGKSKASTENSMAQTEPLYPVENKEIPSQSKEENTSAPAESTSAQLENTSAPALKKSALNSITPLSAEDKTAALEFDKEYTDIISAGREQHIFNFSLTKRGTVKYSLKHSDKNSLGTWRLSLYQKYYVNGVQGETQFRLLNVMTTSPGSLSYSSANIGVMPGNYRIVVSAGEILPEEVYTFSAAFAENTNCEIECNDNIYRYTEIYSTVPMQGSSSRFDDRQDSDWFLFRMSGDGVIRLSFAHEDLKNVSVGWRVTLYDSAQNVLYAENSAFGTVLINSGDIGAVAGDYYIEVASRVYSPADYTLTVKRDNNLYYEHEPNDSFETADIITPNQSIFGAVTSKHGGLDRDFYVFELSESGVASLDFLHSAAASDERTEGWNIRLLNENGVCIYETISAHEDAAISSPKIGLAQGRYYIQIDSENRYRNAETYELLLNFEKSTLWEREINNSPLTATPLLKDSAIFGTLTEAGTDYDYDYYKITLSEPKIICVALTHENNQSERDIFRFSLLDSNEQELPLSDEQGNIAATPAYSVTSAGNQERAEGFYSLEAGEYYIKLSSGRYFDNMIYSIAFTEK